MQDGAVSGNSLGMLIDGGYKNEFYTKRGDMNDMATYATLPSDSSPFHEKYEVDEDGEILGEVSYTLDYLELSK